MKKLFSLVLALAMILSLSVPTFAAEIATNGDTSANVNGTYVAGTESDIVYSVDIAWSAMNFTYTDSSKGDWNTTNHAYENGTAASWSGTGTITVTNHSNDGVVVTPAYTQEEGFADASMNFDTTALTVASADNGEGEEGAGAAKSGTITVTPTGSLPAGTSETKIGTITLTVEGETDKTEAMIVYFQKPENWGNTVNAYVYNSNGKTYTSWPGEAMTFDSNTGYYSYTIPGGDYNMIIFSDGTNQTTDTALPTVSSVGSVDDNQNVTWTPYSE